MVNLTPTTARHGASGHGHATLPVAVALSVTVAVAMAFAVTSLIACARDERPRCTECGMYADVAPAFAVGATDSAGATRLFDAPRCFFRWRLGAEGRGAHDVWVTEHYSQTHVALDRVQFVAGSDVIGPMGRDLVPVARAEAGRFARDHGGRVLEASAIDRAVLGSLDATAP